MESSLVIAGYVGAGIFVFLLLIVKDCFFGIKNKVDASDVFLTLSLCCMAWPLVFVGELCELIARFINHVNNK